MGSVIISQYLYLDNTQRRGTLRQRRTSKHRWAEPVSPMKNQFGDGSQTSDGGPDAVLWGRCRYRLGRRGSRWAKAAKASSARLGKMNWHTILAVSMHPALQNPRLLDLLLLIASCNDSEL